MRQAWPLDLRGAEIEVFKPAQAAQVNQAGIRHLILAPDHKVFRRLSFPTSAINESLIVVSRRPGVMSKWTFLAFSK